MAANTQYLGNTAAIRYWPVGSSTASTSGRVTFLLPTKLKALKPAFRVVKFERTSLDYSAREVFTIVSTGTNRGVYELVGTIRFNKDRQGLIDMIRHGMYNQNLFYVPVIGSSGTFQKCKLIEPSDTVTLDLDSDRGDQNDMEVTIRLRRTDGGSFTAVL